MKKITIKKIMSFFLLVIIISICMAGYINTKEEEVELKIVTEKDTYENGEWISYSVIIANNSEQSVYHYISSCNVEITGKNGFHVITDIDDSSNIYELKPHSKVKRDMTGYNRYDDFPHAMGIKNFSGAFRLKDTEDSVAKLNVNWNTALCLPKGEYTFLAEFLYYDDEGCLTKPQKITTTKKIHVISDGSTKIEESILLEDRIRFYATSDKNIYRTKESIHTWGKIETVEGQWYQWDPPGEYFCPSIILINCDTGEERDIYNRLSVVPDEYKEPFFLLPNVDDQRGIMLNKWLKKEGNYIIQYEFPYISYETQEYKIATINLPITVIPNESEQTFYSSSHPVIKGFEEYDGD